MSSGSEMRKELSPAHVLEQHVNVEFIFKMPFPGSKMNNICIIVEHSTYNL